MKKIRTGTLLAALVGIALLCSLAAAQQKSSTGSHASLAAYDARREVTLIGTVQAYTSASQTPPRGPHATLLTAAGSVDVQLGNAQLLAANHFTIQTGDTLRIIGENLASGDGTQFVARVVQKGTQALVVRSVRGIPLSYMAPRDAVAAKPQGGVL